MAYITIDCYFLLMIAENLLGAGHRDTTVIREEVTARL